MRFTHTAETLAAYLHQALLRWSGDWELKGTTVRRTRDGLAFTLTGGDMGSFWFSSAGWPYFNVITEHDVVLVAQYIVTLAPYKLDDDLVTAETADSIDASDVEVSA